MIVSKWKTYNTRIVTVSYFACHHNSFGGCEASNDSKYETVYLHFLLTHCGEICRKRKEYFRFEIEIVCILTASKNRWNYLCYNRCKCQNQSCASLPCGTNIIWLLT
jgi:hypothetical protein